MSLVMRPAGHSPLPITTSLLVAVLIAAAAIAPAAEADPAAGAGAAAAAAGPTAATPADQPLIDAIAAKAQAVVTVTGHYQQRTLNAGDSEPEVRLGSFAIQAPDRYNLIETKPGDADWKKRQCCDGHTQWEIEQVFPDVRPSVTTHADGAGDGALRRVMACVRGDLAVLETDFTLAATADGTGYRLTLLPRGAEIARDVSRVVIALDSDAHAHSLAIEQPSGTRITLTITDAVYNQPVPDADFRYTSP